MEQIEITEEPVKHHRDRCHEPFRSDLGDGVRGHGVEGVGEHRRTKDDANRLIDHGQGVVAEDYPVVSGLLAEQRELGAPFTECQV